ncbi:hypothetical protein KJ865_09655, partial [Myxococcota bacterium]|nr:hypothetical protein [Myxococcota bacterium]
MTTISLMLSVLLGQVIAPGSASNGIKTHAPAHSENSGKGEQQIKILYFADIMGNFSGSTCSGSRVGRRSLLHLKQLIRRIRVTDGEKGLLPPLVMGGGSVNSPSAFGEYVFGDARRARWGVRFMEGMRADVMALGPSDIAAPTENLKRFLDSGSEYRFPFLASNISCVDKKDYRCKKQIKQYIIVERGGVRLGVVALFRKDQASLMMKRAGRWLRFDEPVAAWKKLYGQLRKKVHGVILISHLDRTASFPTANIAFLRKIEPEPILVLATGSSDPDSRTANNIPLIKRARGAHIVGSARFAKSLTVVTLPFIRVGNKWTLNSQGVAVTQPVPRLGGLDLNEKRKLSTIVRTWCDRVNRHLGKAVFKKPMSQKEFIIYTLRTARIRAKAEVAVINRSLFMAYAFPMQGKVTEEKIALALRTDSPMVTANIKGASLISLLGAHATSATGGLAVEGLSKKGTTWYVNKRVLQADQHYRVVTTKFVATGGGGHLSALPSYSEREVGVRAMLVQWFEKGGAARFDQDRMVSVEDDFPDFWKTFVITGGTNLGLTMGSTTRGNPRLYEGRTQLEKDNLKQINMDLTFTGAILNQSHAISMRTRLLYGKTWTSILDPETQIS